MQKLLIIILLFSAVESYGLQFMDPKKVPDNTYKIIGVKTGVEISKARPEDITPENYPNLVETINQRNCGFKRCHRLH